MTDFRPVAGASIALSWLIPDKSAARPKSGCSPPFSVFLIQGLKEAVKK
jgi:hypothetical protein